MVEKRPIKVEYQELAEFRYRLRKFLHFSEQAAADVGITPNQHQLLLTIAGFSGRDWMTPTEIAERLQIRHHSGLGLIQRCEKLEFVRRFDNPTDRRSVCIELTDKGREVLERLTMQHQAELQRLGLSHRNFLTTDMTSFDEEVYDGERNMSLFLKRAYELPEPQDGTRILVDRLWPRGLRKETAQIDEWLKEVAPSTELRKWFHHDRGRFEAFKALYVKELQEEPCRREAVRQLLNHVENGPVTLVYGAQDSTMNHAVVLRQFVVNSLRRID